jgi:hypothetical protein
MRAHEAHEPVRVVAERRAGNATPSQIRPRVRRRVVLPGREVNPVILGTEARIVSR